MLNCSAPLFSVLYFVFPMIFSFSILSCISYFHLGLGCPLLLFPPSSLSNFRFGSLPIGNIIHVILHAFTTSTRFGSSYKSCSSWFVLLTHLPPTIFPPNVFLKIFLSHIANIFSSFLLIYHILLPYTYCWAHYCFVI